MAPKRTETATKENVDAGLTGQYLAIEPDEVAAIDAESKQVDFKPQYVYRNIILFALLHVGAIVGFYQLIFVAKWPTVGCMLAGWFLSGLGITAGAHRLWSHRSFKARWPARLFLMLCDCMAFQNDVIEWARDHRCHHKWTDTHADPHNVNRGIFFSHMGWLLQKKHPEVKQHGGKLDLSDLFADPILRFQRRFFLPLGALICFVLPPAVCVWGWGENPLVAFYTTALFRYCFTLHVTWCINSAAHRWGYKPYDVNITPTENLWTILTALGEGGHNYHHTFPQDYRTSEYSYEWNATKLVIDVFAAIGLVYDRKVVADEIINRQKTKQPKEHVH